jgi:hypothetical protein
MKNTFPDFNGKLVSLSINGDNYSYTMEQAHFESLGGRAFLVGIVPHGGSKSNWSKGAQCAVAWDSVTHYLVFDSVEHYRTALAKFKDYKKKHGNND